MARDGHLQAKHPTCYTTALALGGMFPSPSHRARLENPNHPRRESFLPIISCKTPHVSHILGPHGTWMLGQSKWHMESWSVCNRQRQRRQRMTTGPRVGSPEESKFSHWMKEHSALILRGPYEPHCCRTLGGQRQSTRAPEAATWDGLQEAEDG